jgi:hypothetical protein
LKKLRLKQRENPIVDSIADILLDFFSSMSAQKLKSAYGKFCMKQKRIESATHYAELFIFEHNYFSIKSAKKEIKQNCSRKRRYRVALVVTKDNLSILSVQIFENFRNSSQFCC